LGPRRGGLRWARRAQSGVGAGTTDRSA